ncbi:MAG: hypothetical protein AMXMBFR46_18370 [Acidimicrobiia bacterium]
MTDQAQTFEVHAERVVPVPVEQLYTAWTTPEAVGQWWGPTGFTCPVAELDVTVGGVSLVAMRAPTEFGMPDIYNTWTYDVVEPGHRLEYVSRFATPDGQHTTPSAAGIPADGVPDAVPHIVTFASVDDQHSRVTVTELGYTTIEARNLSAAGMDQCLDKLAQHLAST